MAALAAASPLALAARGAPLSSRRARPNAALRAANQRCIVARANVPRRARRVSVRAMSVSAPPAASPAAEPASSTDQFDWHKAWYPVSPVDFLDPAVPNKLKLLGRSMVAWRGADGAWAVASDSCPHRMAPLSLGYLDETGRLTCRYHGWAFETDGKAAAIPMSVDDAAAKTACASPRSCAETFPAKAEAGVLWVWPTSGADAWLEASATPVATALADKGELTGEWGMVELPVGYAPALENQFDPSHAEWLHARYDAENGSLSKSENVPFTPMTSFAVRQGSMNGSGFVVDHGGYNEGNKTIRAERVFTAPCSSRSEYVDADGARYLSAAILYAPTEPGRCLMFTKFQAHQRTAVQGAGRKKITTADRVASLVTGPIDLLFRWYMQTQTARPELVRVGMNHGVYGNAAYTLGDQDIQAMHGVEVAMESVDKDWKSSYYLPTPADAGVAGFRNWMDKHAGGGVRWAEGVEDDASKVKPLAQQLDRYDRHTRHCRHCRECLSELGELEAKLVNVANVACGAGLALGMVGGILGQEAPAVVSLCVAGLATGAAEKTRDMQQEFKTSVKRRGDPIPKLW